MTKRRCTSALAVSAIVLLCAIVVVVWVQFSLGAFDRRQQLTNAPFNNNQSTNNDPLSIIKVEKADKKEFIEKTHLEGTVQDAIYVKPLKLHLDGHRNKSAKPHTGHFRHHSYEDWDHAPTYEIDAFGKKLILELVADSSFIVPNLHIVTHGQNVSQRYPHDQKISGCFYKGKIQNDPDSDVTISLCHGMTGYIRSSTDNYYIEPAENLTNNLSETLLHRIKKLPHATTTTSNTEHHESNDVFDYFDGTNGNDQDEGHIIEDDFREATSHINRTKRDLRHYARNDIFYDIINRRQITEEESKRNTRQSDYAAYSDVGNVYHLRALIVADSTMLEFHRTHQELTKYILTLMSHVALLYKEPSIGNAINVAVVHIRILERPIPEFYNKSSLKYKVSKELIREFCEWKQKNIQDKHNVAVLLTRHPICADDKTCNTLGVAEVASLCRDSASAGCAIVKDKGLFTSYTIAHEFGHTLSMVHDDDTKCTVHNANVQHPNHIMTRTPTQESKPFTWSRCSRQFVTDFVSKPRARCLLEPASREEIPIDPATLPGTFFELDKQCELEGAGYTSCKLDLDKGIYVPCVYLWCATPSGGCQTHHSPWAEGTKCGPSSWCYKRQCTPIDSSSFMQIDGGWGAWQPWGPCSRTCGGGIKKSVRYCDSPVPENGGNYCIGDSVQYMSCNTEDCDENEPSFRAVQCAEFNGDPRGYQGLDRSVRWIPATPNKSLYSKSSESEDYCRLICKAEQGGQTYDLRNKAKDGTKCGPDNFGICVNGVCKPGGCDNKLNSKAAFDECGECGGDNSSCRVMTGTYNRRAEQVSYNRVIRIPKGSLNLNITQHSFGQDENYLALKDGETGRYLLNGHQMFQTQELEIEFASVTIKYSGSVAQPEWIVTERRKKLRKDLIIEVFSMKSLSPPNIAYRYVIGNDIAPSALDSVSASYSRYNWRLYQTKWSECSSICEGKQYRTPICIELSTNKEVHGSFCDGSDIDTATEKRSCNNHCTLTWHVASKSACSPHCGKGYRQVYYSCMKLNKKQQFDMNEVNSQHCNILTKPTGTEPCYTPCNITRWDYSTWTECSKTCGGGVQVRQAKCVDEHNRPIDDSHCSGKEKIVEQRCNIEICPDWVIGETSECSVPCGGGHQNVSVYCALKGRITEPFYCDQRSKPSGTQNCNEHACGRWEKTDTFHPCSVQCGKGVEKRKYVCKKFDTEDVIDEQYCDGIRVPREDTRACYRECNRLTYVDDKYPYNPINENSVYDRYDRYKTFQWTPSDWTECSELCGGGTKKQQFLCRNDLGVENAMMCDRYDKPRDNVVRCNEDACPQWKVGEYSPRCDSNCERHRQVRCMNDEDTFDDKRCDLTKKPQTSTKCKLSECPHASGISKSYFAATNQENRYRWRAGPWNECSSTCGKGTRKRVIECIDQLNDITVVDTLCRNTKRKPKDSKPCERYKCDYTWIEGPYSRCSRTCGQGVMTRHVTCHKVHPGGVIDRKPINRDQPHVNPAKYCRSRKPKMVMNCMINRCEDKYMWLPGEWTPCTHECGKKGRQVRDVNCINVLTKQRVQRHFCAKNLRPYKKRKCNQWKCLEKNCKEIQTKMRTRENKDYLISINGMAVKVYCYKMDTPYPQEYISLHSDQSNFAEIYDRRLRDLSSCPYNGQRRDNCVCDNIGPEHSGRTIFWKVRLNTTSLQILGDDFTFSKQIKGHRIPYGTAGDCYSSHGSCPQGQFSIDLRHTSFKLSSDIRWKNTGQFASKSITKRSDVQIEGKCGGYCGECVPDPTYGGLKVEIT
ncbi:A disintegrin and metalloproteinase with thrombospondin motifs 9-like isoform X2 [Anthonomus grandis grandis]|uniref:A disintegrin and metalloproteinase with thrombospondin motifs 9-like isoform X2 n=1 Tax=Anthonomus grandis grandis TaxID=2921223 RepID=UPI002166135D|nr:A disintegrin and metalloproteinase with thrombospondin motifs 9-like isoform X2 [Anthonomus grandis grandis]